MNLMKLERAFRTDEQCRNYLERIRWPNGPECLKCGAPAWKLKDRMLYECSECGYQFSIRVGTIFENSHLSLTIWFRAIYFISESKKGVSAMQIKRMFDVSYRTAWYLMHRIRNAMKETDIAEKLMGVLEIDETYVGGKTKGQTGRPGKNSNKVPVMGMIERGGGVRVQKVPDVTGRTIKDFVDQWTSSDVEVIYSDQYRSYNILRSQYEHDRVDHSVTYVNGDIHTNGIENFWSLLKRGLMGVFHKVSVKHLSRYLDEFTFRFNARERGSVMALILENCEQPHIPYAEMVS